MDASKKGPNCDTKMDKINPAESEERETPNKVRRKFSFSKTTFLLKGAKYARSVRFIKNGLTVPYNNTLLVWSTMQYQIPAFILSAMPETADFRHLWSCQENSRNQVWSGSVAVFKSTQILEQAANRILALKEDVKVLWFPDMINVLVCAEMGHSLYREGVSRILIKGPRSFDLQEVTKLQNLLKGIGDVKKILLKSGREVFGVIAEAHYSYASQAFIAKYFLNGSVFGKLGVLHVAIIEGQKETYIRETATRIFNDMLF